MSHLNEQLDRSKQLMGLITEAYGGGKIKEGDVPCDIWCKRKVAKLGSRGDVVKMIQNVLAGGCGEYGPYNPEKLGGGLNEGCAENWTDCDGKFGPETEKAVEEFQGEGGLTLDVDGKVGFNTLSALCKVCYSPGSPKDSAEHILCQKQCQCDDQETDKKEDDSGIQDVIDEIREIEDDSQDINTDDLQHISIDGTWTCERIKACLYYTNLTSPEPDWLDFVKCMEGIFDRTSPVYGECDKKCLKGCPQDPPVGTPVTAVMSWCWSGDGCRQLSWGGGPFNSKEECEKCSCKVGYIG